MQTCRRRSIFMVLEGNRRRSERRTAEPRIHLPERRTGFDRRTAKLSHPLLRFLDGGVRLLAREPWRLGLLLAFVVALGWLDLIFTLDALAAGATEANPLMAQLLHTDIHLAAVIKIGVTVGVALTVWRLRAYRRIIEAALFILGTMFALITYQIVLHAMIS